MPSSPPSRAAGDTRAFSGAVAIALASCTTAAATAATVDGRPSPTSTPVAPSSART